MLIKKCPKTTGESVASRAYFRNMKSKNNYINEAIKNPRYGIFYQGKLVRKYPFYKDARNYCKLHNHGKDSLPFPEVEDICELVDLGTGEILNNLFSGNPSQ